VQEQAEPVGRGVTADNNGSERELRPTATHRKVAGGIRSTWDADPHD
jgi:hypothetical protein